MTMILSTALTVCTLSLISWDGQKSCEPPTSTVLFSSFFVFLFAAVVVGELKTRASFLSHESRNRKPKQQRQNKQTNKNGFVCVSSLSGETGRRIEFKRGHNVYRRHNASALWSTSLANCMYYLFIHLFGSYILAFDKLINRRWPKACTDTFFFFFFFFLLKIFLVLGRGLDELSRSSRRRRRSRRRQRRRCRLLSRPMQTPSTTAAPSPVDLVWEESTLSPAYKLASRLVKFREER